MGEAERRLLREDLVAQRTYVRALARRLVLDPGMAEDVSQEALLAALESPPAERGALRQWLSRVVRNIVYKTLRADERRRRREKVRARRDLAPAAGDVVADLHMHREVVDALLELEEPYRSTLICTFFEDMPPREIAAKQGLPGGTVRSHISRGIDKLRKILDARHGSRRAWCLALLPLAFPVRTAAASGGAVAATAGVVAMSTKSKTVVAAALLLLLTALTATAVWKTSPDRGERRAAEPGPSPVVPPAEAREEEPTEDLGGARPYTATVEVIDRAGRPVPGATVTVHRWPVRLWPAGLPSWEAPWFERDWGSAMGRTDAVATARTGADGRASFRLSMERHWRVKARKAGFSEAEAYASEDVKLRLHPAHPLAGRVIDPGGQPVPGAMVLAGPAELARQNRFNDFPHSTVADGQGRYRLDGMAAGDLSVWAAFPGGAPIYVATVRVPDIAAFDVMLARGGTLRGRVTEKETGRPVAGVTVDVRMEGPPQTFGRAVTNARGEYVIDTLPPGQVDAIHAAGAGYAQDPGGTVLKNRLPLERGAAITHDIELVKAGAIHGTVVSADSPVAGAHVDVACMWSAMDRVNYVTRTNARGEYRIEGLAPGRYLVRASAEGLYHPGAHDPFFGAFEEKNRDRLTEIGPGADVEHALVLRKGDVVVEGAVEDENGGPLPGVRVSYGGQQAETDEHGRFRIENAVPSGMFGQLNARLEGYKTFGYPTIDTKAGQHVTGVLLRLRRKVVRKLVGRVVGPDFAEPFVLVKQYHVRQAQYLQSREWRRYPVGPDGRFEVELAEGMTPLEGIAVKAGALGAGLSPAESIEVDERTTYEVELELEPTVALEGTVRSDDGRPLPGARIALRPPLRETTYQEHPRARSPVVAVADANGAYKARVGAGEYELHAWAPGHVDGFANVVLPTTAPLEIELESTRALAGRVVTPDGEAVGRIMLTIQRLSRSGAAGWRNDAERLEYERWGKLHDIWTDAGSAFYLDGLKRGAYRVTVGSWSGGPNVVRTVFGHVEAGRTDLTLTVRRGKTIAGRVVGSDGKGVAGVYVSAKGTDPEAGRQGRTDESGNFTITGLPPGSHELSATVSQGRGTRRIVQNNVAAGSTGIVLRADTQFYRIAGRLLDQHDKPVANVALYLRATRKTPTASTTQAVTDAAGRFEVDGLFAVPYQFDVADARYRSLLLVGGEQVPAGRTDVVLRLVPGAAIAGELRDPEGRPFPDGYLLVRFDGHARRGKTDERGRFEITGLPEGVDVSLTIHSREFPTQRREVASGTRGLVITLEQGLSTTGRVLDAQGKPLAETYLIFEEESGATVSTKTDADGRFEVDLLARTYRVTARRPRLDPVACGSLKGGARNVTLRE